MTNNDVKKSLRMEEVMEAVQLAFAEKAMNRAQIPAKVFLQYPKYNGDGHTTPSYPEGLDIPAVEIPNVHEEKHDRVQASRSHGNCDNVGT